MTGMITAGIDVGQKYLDVGLAPSRKTFRVPNLPEGIATVLRRLTEEGVSRVVMEAIGPYCQAIARGLSLAGFAVGVVNPRRIKAYREACGGGAKTDRLDARLMARFALEMHDAIRPLPDAAALELKALAARRRQLVEMIAIEKTRLKQATMEMIAAGHRRAIADLGVQCREIEAELARRIAADATLARTYGILTSIPGIGPRIATLLVTDLPELGQRDRKTIAALAGLAPRVSQSGNTPPRAHIEGGRPCVRAGLFMAALVAVRHSPLHRRDYKAMVDAGKPKKVALIAIARKILVLANALVKDKRNFNPDHNPT